MNLTAQHVNNYNSPFNIAAAGLDISSDKLIETLTNYYDRFKNEAKQTL